MEVVLTSSIGINFDKFPLEGVHKNLFATRNFGSHLGLRLKIKPKEAIRDGRSQGF
jgi:hypothetical protein